MATSPFGFGILPGTVYQHVEAAFPLLKDMTPAGRLLAFLFILPVVPP